MPKRNLTEGSAPKADQLLERVEALMAQERWREALDLLEGSAEVVQADYRLSWNQGWALLRSNDAVTAASAFERANALEPDNQIALWGLGLAQREMGNLAEAELSMLRSIALRDSAPARLALANLYVQLGRMDEAEMIQREGVRLQPNDRERLEALADLLDDLERNEEATLLRQRASTFGRV